MMTLGAAGVPKRQVSCSEWQSKKQSSRVIKLHVGQKTSGCMSTSDCYFVFDSIKLRHTLALRHTPGSGHPNLALLPANVKPTSQALEQVILLQS